MYKLPAIFPRVLSKSDGWEYFHVENVANNLVGSDRLGFIHEKHGLVVITSACSFARELSANISRAGALSNIEPSTAMCLWVLNQINLLDAKEIPCQPTNKRASRTFTLRHC